MTNCPGTPGTVPESRVCVPRPGRKQSGTNNCRGIGSTALIMVKELFHLARIGMKLTLPNLLKLISFVLSIPIPNIKCFSGAGVYGEFLDWTGVRN